MNFVSYFLEVKNNNFFYNSAFISNNEPICASFCLDFYFIFILFFVGGMTDRHASFRMFDNFNK
jgi:hypothetical protein